MSEAPQDHDPVREELERERSLLQERAHELDAREDDLEYDVNFADSAQVAAEQGENKLLYDQLKRDLDDVEKALARMDAGTYGTCEVCGAEIGEARLEVMPSTRVCIDHA